MDLEKEWKHFTEALKSTTFPKVTKRKLVLDMIGNAIAAVIAYIVFAILHKFFVVKSIKNFWGVFAKKNKMLISKETFEIISGIIVFLVVLFVFTYIESLFDNYMNERSKNKQN